MKKRLAVLMTAAVLVGMLSSCGSETTVTESTVELTKKGKLIEYTIEEFSASYYDVDELSDYISAAVEAYEDGEVSVTTCEVEEGIATLTIEYDSVDTYAGILGTDAFSGTILEAQKAGYTFDGTFTDGTVESTDEAEDELSVEVEEISGYIVLTGTEVTENDDLKVLVIETDMDIIVPGTIQYISIGSVKVTAKNTVQFTGDTAELVYVIYK